jgi:hypothetical protein
MRSRIASAVRLALWTAGLLVVARVLRATGPGPLGLPVESADALRAWVERASPVDAVLAALRTAAVLATWYLLAATILVAAWACSWAGPWRRSRARTPRRREPRSRPRRGRRRRWRR